MFSLQMEDQESSTSESSAAKDEERERKKKAALARREKLLAQMKSQQKNFMKENASLFDDKAENRKRTESVCSVEVEVSFSEL